MTNEKLSEVLEFYYDELDKYEVLYHQHTEPTNSVEVLQHVKWMTITAQNFIPDHVDKAMRWLGFIQGVLFSLGFFTIEELREHSRTNDRCN